MVQTVKTDSFSMDYFKFGSGDKTLVILPGMSVQSVMGAEAAVKDAYSILADEFTLYLFERRNELPKNYPVIQMARDTVRAFKALGLEDIYLFGASQGGMMAMAIATENPYLIKKLAVASTACCINDKRFGIFGKWAELSLAGKADELFLSFGEAVYPKAVFEQYRDYFINTAKSVTPKELERFAVISNGMQGFDITDDLENIACPVLLMGSADDYVFGTETTGEIASRLSSKADFEQHMYTGCGHAIYDTAPDFKQRLLEFFIK